MMRIMTIILVLLWWWWVLIMIKIIVKIDIDVLIVFYMATSSYMHLLHMFLRHSVLTVIFIHHRMVEMLSIGLVNIKNGMWRSFSSWRELILTWRIRWVLINDHFTDPYHLYLYCIVLVIDDTYAYLVFIIIHVNHLTRMDIYLTLSLCWMHSLVTCHHFYLLSNLN